MARYIKLYGIYLQRAIKSRLEYKKDAIIGIGSFLINNICSLLSLVFIVNSIPSLNGWSMYELGFLYGFSMIPRAIDHLLTDSLWYIGFWYVRTGEIDRFLIRPVNVLFQVIAETFQPEAMGEAILGGVLLIACGMHVDFVITVPAVIMIIAAIVFGSVIFTSLKLITCSIAFWTKRSGQLMSMTYNMSDFAKYPIGIYHPVVKFILAFIIPFGMIVSIPVEILIHGTYNAWAVTGTLALIAAVLFTLGCLVWNAGLANYESAGN